MEVAMTTITATRSTSRIRSAVAVKSSQITMTPKTIQKIMVKNQRTKQNHRRCLTCRGYFPSVVQLLRSPLAIVLLCFATFIVPSRGQNTLNRAPHFVPGQDMSQFSLSESTPVNSPVYQLRGKVIHLKEIILK